MKPIDPILKHLQESIEDQFLSRDEKKTLRQLVEETPLNSDDVMHLRKRIFELAADKATAENYRFVVDWIKDATHAILTPATLPAETYFSPGDHCKNAIIKSIHGAVKQLQICVFTISDDTITQALLLSNKKGINIRIITDNDKSLDEGSDIAHLASEGISVRMDRTANHMHHKFMVVDDRLLITGSYNWTRSAARFNHENIILSKEDAVIKSFSQEFENLWKVMSEY